MSCKILLNFIQNYLLPDFLLDYFYKYFESIILDLIGNSQKIYMQTE